MESLRREKERLERAQADDGSQPDQMEAYEREILLEAMTPAATRRARRGSRELDRLPSRDERVSPSVPAGPPVGR